ncbi:hypothetical protein, partial [Agromyces mediolanus]
MTDHTTGPVSEEPRDPEERDVTEAADVTGTNDAAAPSVAEAAAAAPAAAPSAPEAAAAAPAAAPSA